VEIYSPETQWKQILFHSNFKQLLLLIGLFSLIGCATTPPTFHQEMSMVAFESNESFTVAVLPFVDNTDSEGIANLVRRSFYGHLSVRPYRDIELHLVDQKLSEHNLTDLKVLYTMPITELGRVLECDAVILGEITIYQRLFLGVYSQLAVGATISIWDTRSGEIIWTDRHVARFHEGGVPFSLFEIPLISLRSGWNLRNKVTLRTVDELSYYLVEQIPKPAIIHYTGKVKDTRTN
jgi:hypothetical protein